MRLKVRAPLDERFGDTVPVHLMEATQHTGANRGSTFALTRGKSVDFTGHWQRHQQQRAVLVLRFSAQAIHRQPLC